MKAKISIRTLAAWTIFAALPGTALCLQSAQLVEVADAHSADATLYANGTRAINDGRWHEAIGLFSQVAQMHSEHAGGALYWKAYAENKEGQSTNALTTCAELVHLYPKSTWLDECRALEIEIRRNSGNPVQPQNEPDAELKLLALNALMQQEPARAFPVLEKLLESNQSEEMKSRALFVLAQNQTPQAQELIKQIAQGQKGPALQVKAIRMIAVGGGAKSGEMLADIYQHSPDEAVKRAILQSYVASGDSARLLKAARQETNPELVRTAMHSLGALGAASDLLTLYRATTNAETKRDIINSLVACGQKGVSALNEIASIEQSPDLRRSAIRSLGISGGSAVTQQLIAAYQRNSDTETRKAVAQALFLANDAHDLVALARAEKDPEMKQYLVQQLSIMRNQESTDYMLEILNK